MLLLIINYGFNMKVFISLDNLLPDFSLSKPNGPCKSMWLRKWVKEGEENKEVKVEFIRIDKRKPSHSYSIMAILKITVLSALFFITIPAILISKRCYKGFKHTLAKARGEAKVSTYVQKSLLPFLETLQQELSRPEKPGSPESAQESHRNAEPADLGKRNAEKAECISEIRRVKGSEGYYPHNPDELKLLSIEIEECIEGEQDKAVLMNLIKRTFFGLKAYRARVDGNNLKGLSLPVVWSRYAALTKQYKELIGWLQMKNADASFRFTAKRTLQQKIQDDIDDKKNEEAARTRQFFQTNEFQNCYDRTTGLLNFGNSPLSKQAQDAINEVFRVCGLSDGNWKGWLHHDCIDVLFAIAAYQSTKWDGKGVTEVAKLDKACDSDGATEDYQLETALEIIENRKVRLIIPCNPIGPGNKTGAHWTCLFIDPETQQMEWFDSTGSKLIPKAIRDLQGELLKKGLEYTLLNKSTKKVQYNGYDCGAWIGYVAEQRSLNDNFSFADIKGNPGALIAQYRRDKHNQVIAPLIWEYLKDMYASPNGADNFLRFPNWIAKHIKEDSLKGFGISLSPSAE